MPLTLSISSPSGRFAVDVDGRRIAEVGSGSPIGEIGFFAHGIRTATVTALRDSIVLKLPRQAFADFDEQSLTHPRTLAVVGAGGFHVTHASRQGLARALSRFG